jgi:hypothetical protein
MITENWIEPHFETLNEMSQPELFPSFHVWGHTFSPKLLTERTGFRFAEANEPGEINVAGPFRGRPVTYGPGYGAAIIRPPDSVPAHERLSWMVDRVISGHTRKFCKEYGIIEEVFYITAHFGYRQPPALMFPAWVSQALSHIPLVITVVQPTQPPDSFAV